MNLAYLHSTEISFFSNAKEQFKTLISDLESTHCLNLEHGDVEQKIQAEGTEILRLLFQGFLDKKKRLMK